MVLSEKQEINRQRLLEDIYVYGPASRVDIAQRTGITQATVSNMTSMMLQQHEVMEAGEETSKKGRPKVLLKIAGGDLYYVGCELRGDAFTFVLIDSAGKVQDKQATRFAIPFDPELSTVETFTQSLKKFLSEHADRHILAVGIGIPGHYDAKTQHIAGGFPHWTGFDFSTLNNEIKLPIYYENNVQAMAITERLFNSHQSDETFIFFHVAKGMMCSTVYHGRVYGLENPLVGEVAHMVVNTEGELCTCGRHGCLQTYSSENWIMAKARLLYKQADHTYLRQLASTPDELTFENVFQAYDLGDEGVMNILTNAIKYLAVAVTNFTLLIDAQRIVLHGRIFERSALFTQMQQYLKTNQVMFSTVTPKRLTVKPALLFDGAFGAAGMAICRGRLGFS